MARRRNKTKPTEARQDVTEPLPTSSDVTPQEEQQDAPAVTSDAPEVTATEDEAIEDEATAAPQQPATSDAPEDEATGAPEPEVTAEPEPEVTDEPEPEVTDEPEPEVPDEPDTVLADEPAANQLLVIARRDFRTFTNNQVLATIELAEGVDLNTLVDAVRNGLAGRKK